MAMLDPFGFPVYGIQDDMKTFIDQNKIPIAVSGAGAITAIIGGVAGGKVGKIVSIAGIGILGVGLLLMFMKPVAASQTASGTIKSVIIG